MKTKQLVSIIIVCALLIITGISGIVTARVQNRIEKDRLSSIKELFLSGQKELSVPSDPYIGRIDVVGTIQGSSSTSAFLEEEQYNHSLYIRFINRMMEDDNNKGIMLYVDSPGGTVYHSDELYLKLMEYKEKTGRPIRTYFGSTACSGGYYVSMASDSITANRNCWTGSIGVVISMLNYKELAEKLGVKYEYIVSGNNKAMGAATEELSEDQRAIYQSLVDEAYDQFTGIVSEGRNIPVAKVKLLADGRIYSAYQALDNGLVDDICGYEEFRDNYLEDLDYPELYAPENEFNFFGYLYGMVNSSKSGSDSDIRAFMDLMDKDESGVLYYYAG